MKIKLGVIFGGMSVEHEVSVITALQAMESLDPIKYDIIPIYIDKQGRWYAGNLLRDIKVYNDLDLLKRYAPEVVLYKKDNRFVLQNKNGLFKKEVCDVDIMFPIMHGTYGEDGSLQGYLDTVGIPYCEANHYAACIGQDKVYMKQVWKDSNVPIVKYTWFYDYDYKTDPDGCLDKCAKIGYPLIIKPACLGSSVGIVKAKNREELALGIEEAITYDSKILVEECLENFTEVNISVLGNYRKMKTSVIEEVGGSKDFLSYDDKYVGGSKTKGANVGGMANAKRIIPARISKELTKEVEEAACKAFKSIGCSGVCRIDFMIDNDTKKVYANEINSIPGSLAFYLWEKTDKEYAELLDDVINIAIKDFKDRTNKTTTFDTNILKNYENRGVKGVKGVKGKK